MFLWLGNPLRKEDIHVWWKAPNKIRSYFWAYERRNVKQWKLKAYLWYLLKSWQDSGLEFTAHDFFPFFWPISPFTYNPAHTTLASFSSQMTWVVSLSFSSSTPPLNERKKDKEGKERTNKQQSGCGNLPNPKLPPVSYCWRKEHQQNKG